MNETLTKRNYGFAFPPDEAFIFHTKAFCIDDTATKGHKEIVYLSWSRARILHKKYCPEWEWRTIPNVADNKDHFLAPDGTVYLKGCWVHKETGYEEEELIYACRDNYQKAITEDKFSSTTLSDNERRMYCFALAWGRGIGVELYHGEELKSLGILQNQDVLPEEEDAGIHLPSPDDPMPEEKRKKLLDRIKQMTEAQRGPVLRAFKNYFLDDSFDGKLSERIQTLEHHDFIEERIRGNAS